MHESAGFPGTARIERLRVQNYRVLRDLKLRDIAPLTVLLGPNGSGKSTLFDVFAFLSECFTDGLRRAWDKRNRFRELRSRGADGPIVFELKYRERRGNPVITYHLAIDERRSGPVVAEEWLQWKRGQYGRPFRFLDFREGVGDVISGEQPELNDQRNRETLESPDLLAVNTLGQFARHPRVSALRRFISGWYLSYVAADLLADGRLLLQIKDEPFEQPILAKFASDGTLKMLAYLTVLYDPQPPPSSVSRSPRTSCTLACSHSLPRSAGSPLQGANSLSRPTRPTSSMGCGPTSSGCCTGTTMGSLGLDQPAGWTRSGRLWPREPSSGTCGWRDTSRSVTLSLLQVD